MVHAKSTLSSSPSGSAMSATAQVRVSRREGGSGVMTATPSGSRLLRVMLAVPVLVVPVSSVAVAVHVKVSPGEAVSLESARVGPVVPSLHA